MPQSYAEQPLEMNIIFNGKNTETEQKSRKPIFLADGLVALDILKSFSRNIPNDLFFCPTSLTSISKCVLADYLKVSKASVYTLIYNYSPYYTIIRHHEDTI